MSLSGRKLFIWIFILGLVSAAGLESQDSTSAVSDSSARAAASDSVTPPPDTASDSTAKAASPESTQAPPDQAADTTSRGSAPDSVRVQSPDSGASAPAAPALPVTAPALPDSTPPAAGTDTTAPKAGALTTTVPPDTSKKTAPPVAGASKPARPRPTGDQVEAEVIPWDWDDFTNVIAVGLKSLRNQREYELEANAPYDTLFRKFQGQKVRAWGKVARDRDGFYSMTINQFEPLDSLAAAPADSLGAPGDSLAKP